MDIYKFNIKNDLPDKRDIIYIPERHLELDTYVDFRNNKLYPPVYDQLQLNSSIANALAFMFEYDEIEQYTKAWSPSRLFLYYQEREYENTQPVDIGTSIRNGIKSLLKYGVCSENMWTYDINKYNIKPPSKCYENEHKTIKTKYFRIQQNIRDLKIVISNLKRPIIFSFIVNESFLTGDIKTTGIFKISDKETINKEKILGSHTAVIVGYDDDKKSFIVRNSFGNNWGENGHFYLPYSVIFDNQITFNFWMLDKIKSIPSNKNSSITITSPIKGEKWNTGTTNIIAWVSTGNIKNIRIRLGRKSWSGLLSNWIEVGFIENTDSAGALKFEWKIPLDIQTHASYYLQLSDQDLNIFVESDIFTISSNPNN